MLFLESVPIIVSEVENNMKKCLSSVQIKYLALLAMLTDHFAYIFRSSLSTAAYYGLRGVGRLAFPIFCFCLVEGFFRTTSHRQYLLRLVLFSILSEIPYNLGLLGVWFNPARQNVFFTLAIGFFGMMILEGIYPRDRSFYVFGFLTPLVADIFRADYGALGVLCILAFYLVAKRILGMVPLSDTDESPLPAGGSSISLASASLPWLLLPCMVLLPMAGRASHYIQAACLLAAPVMCLYSGKKGQGSKYFFYLFYPVHLLFLRATHHFFIHGLP